MWTRAFCSLLAFFVVCFFCVFCTHVRTFSLTSLLHLLARERVRPFRFATKKKKVQKKQRSHAIAFALGCPHPSDIIGSDGEAFCVRAACREDFFYCMRVRVYNTLADAHGDSSQANAHAQAHVSSTLHINCAKRARA